MFIVAYFMWAPNWKQPKCPLRDAETWIYLYSGRLPSKKKVPTPHTHGDMEASRKKWVHTTWFHWY